MKLIQANIWDKLKEENTAACITTNGATKWQGSRRLAVMGRGCALQASSAHPMLSRQLAGKLELLGNHVFWFSEYRLFTFPTKGLDPWANSSLELIAQSARELQALLDIMVKPPEFVFLPRPGCGEGKLTWKHVEPVLDLYLTDSRIIVTHF